MKYQNISAKKNRKYTQETKLSIFYITQSKILQHLHDRSDGMVRSAEFLLDCLNLDRRMGYPHSSVNNYQSTLINNPYERKTSPTLRWQLAVTSNTTFLDCSSAVFGERVGREVLLRFREYKQFSCTGLNGKHIASVVKTKRLKVLRKIIAVYCKDHTQHTN